jgi:LEA14-like dessication related protein
MVFCSVMAKKQIKTVVIVGLVGAALYWLSQRTLALISFGSPSMRIHKVTLNSIDIRITLPIVNQSDIPAPVTAFLGDVFYNGTSLGSLTLVQPVTLPGFGKTTLEFSLVSGLFGSALEILNILTNGNPLAWKTANYKNLDFSKFLIKGTLKVGNLPFPVQSQLV